MAMCVCVLFVLLWATIGEQQLLLVFGERGSARICSIHTYIYDICVCMYGGV